jgi:hypothetical protein
MKKLLSGLIHRQQALPPLAWREVVAGGIIPVHWADIQPSSGKWNFGPIEQELTKAKAAGRRVKLKVYAGRYAPEWVKNIGGAPPCLYDPPSTRSCYTVPRWWEPAVVEAYRALLVGLGGRYDADPAVATLQASLTGTLFAEPFLRQAVDEDNRQRLLAAGFSVEADERALKAMIDAHALLLPYTRMDLAVHPYQRINPDGTYGKQDQDFTSHLMEYANTMMGNRVAFGYTALGKVPEDGSPEEELFEVLAEFGERGHPLWFQTETLEKLGDTCADLKSVLLEAVDYGAYAVELPAGYQTTCNPKSLQDYSRALQVS